MGLKLSSRSCINYLDDIPPIPDDLLEPLDVIISRQSMTPNNYVQNKKVSMELFDWLTKTFNRPIIAYYQVMHNDIDPHVDRKRTKAINYLIQTGGENATTFIYKQKAKPGPYKGTVTVEESKILELNRWHSIDVTRIHAVKNIESNHPRISVSVMYQEDFHDDFWSKQYAAYNNETMPQKANDNL